jgi:nicotinate-nucleotide--dimethylbenzimidazole phosphoribosyltransferase
MVLFAVYFLIAHQMNPAIIKNAIFCHCSRKQASIKVLELKSEGYFKFRIALGRRNGLCDCVPIIQSAVILNEMAL